MAASQFGYTRVETSPAETGMFRYQVTEREQGIALGAVRRDGQSDWLAEGVDAKFVTREQAALALWNMYLMNQKESEMSDETTPASDETESDETEAGLPEITDEELAQLSATEIVVADEVPGDPEAPAETPAEPAGEQAAGAGSDQCHICGKPLSLTESRIRGIGPVCFGRVVRYMQSRPNWSQVLTEMLGAEKAAANPFQMQPKELESLAPAVEVLSEDSFRTLVTESKAFARTAGRLSYNDVVGEGDLPSKADLEKDWIKIGELVELAYEQGKSSGAIQRAVGGHGNIYQNRGPAWRNFYAYGTHWVSRDAIAELPTLDSGATRGPKPGSRKVRPEITSPLGLATQARDSALAELASLRDELETVQARLSALPALILDAEAALPALEQALAEAIEADRVAREEAAKLLAESAAKAEAAKAEKAAASSATKTAAPAKRVSEMTNEEKLARLEAQAKRAEERAAKARALLAKQAAAPTNPEVAEATSELPRTASGSYDYASTPEGQAAYAAAKEAKARLDAEAAAKQAEQALS